MPAASRPSIEAAEVQDLAAVQALLRGSQLPYVDLTEAHMADFLVARDADGSVKGSIGLERYASAGLLRSLVVDSSIRRAGVGQALLQSLQVHAAATGIERLYLLTTTATSFFKARGFCSLPRADAPADLKLSAEFTSLCPASADCMFINLPLP